MFSSLEARARSARGRLEARREGALQGLHRVLQGSPPRESAVEALRALVALLVDGAAVEAWGCIGGHQLLVMAVGAYGDDEDLGELVATATGLCIANAPPGVTFPAKRSLELPPFPDEFGFPLPAGVTARTGAVVTVFVEPPPSHVRMRSQEDVGLVVWPAAVMMARFLLAKAPDLRGKHVMEVGCGPGVPGIAIAGFCESVILTDNNAAVLRSVANNVAVSVSVDGEGGADEEPVNAGVCCLDWADGATDVADLAARAKLPRPPAVAGFDVVVASDVICRESDVDILMPVVKRLLAPAGVCYLLAPPARTRWGVHVIEEKFRGGDFTVGVSPIVSHPLSPPASVPAESHASDVSYCDQLLLYTITHM